MSFGNFIKSIDYLGLEPKLTYKNQKRYKTCFGGLLSILLALLFIAHFTYSSRDIYYRINPSVTETRISNFNSSKIDLTPINFPFFLGIQDRLNNQNFFIDDTVFNFKASLRIQTRYIDDQGMTFLNYSKIPVDLETCDLYYHFPGLEKEFNTTTYNKALCIAKNQNISIFGQFQNIRFDLFQINVYQCTNSTSKIICKTQQEIDDRLRSAYITIGRSEYLMQPDNFFSPLKKSKNEYFTTVTNYGSKEININLKRIFFTTDSGLIYEDKETRVYIDIDSITELFSSSAPIPGDKYLSIGVRMSLNENYFERRYKRVQDVLASTGGLIKFFFMIFLLIIYFISNKNFYIELVEENSINKHLTEFNIPIKLKSGIIDSQNLKGIDTKEKVLNIFKNSKIKIGFIEYIKLILGIKKSYKDKKGYKNLSDSINVIKSLFDVRKYICIVNQFDNIKKIIFDSDQLNVFNYLPFEEDNIKIFENDKNKIDFSKIVNNLNKRNFYTDQRLLRIIDKEIIKILIDSEDN